MQERMPSDADTGYLYFGLFTWRDLIRVGLTVGAALWYIAFTESSWAGSVLSIGTGVFLGLIWYGVRPYGQPLEVHLYHKVRWLLTLEERR